jgi:hypothetical protein
MKINGTTYPDPTSMKIGLMHIDKAERSASDATMTIDAVAIKRKLEMSWDYLSNSATVSLMSAVTSLTDRFVTIEYSDPLTGAKRTGTFYTGDKEFDTGLLVSGVAQYFKGVSFNAIEK